MLFLKGNVEKTIISFEGREVESNTSINKYIKNLSIENLSTIEGRLEAIKKKYKMKSKTPIYINKDIILVLITPKKEYVKTYINAMAVLSVDGCSTKTTIYFKNKKLDIKVSIKIIRRLLEKSKIIQEGELKYEEKY